MEAATQAKEPERMSPEVLQMLRNSAASLEAAQFSHNGVVGQIVALYRLKETDSVDLETGEITRNQDG